MMRALVTGTLYDAPKARTGQAGKPFTTAKLRAAGKDGATVWCSLIAFGEQADSMTWTSGSHERDGTVSDLTATSSATR